jgi:hypothetical protein
VVAPVICGEPDCGRLRICGWKGFLGEESIVAGLGIVGGDLLLLLLACGFILAPFGLEGSCSFNSEGRANIARARNGRFSSGFISGIGAFLTSSLGFLLSLSRADVDAAFSERGSTADNSTADGVVLVGNAVALADCTGRAFVVVGLLNKPSSVER